MGAATDAASVLHSPLLGIRHPAGGCPAAAQAGRHLGGPPRLVHLQTGEQNSEQILVDKKVILLQHYISILLKQIMIYFRETKITVTFDS